MPPNSIGIMHDKAKALVFLFLARRNTPKAAPPCANVAQAMGGRMVS